MRRAVLALLLFVAPARAQEPPPSDPNDIVNVLLGGLLGFRDLSGPELQKEVAEVGGVPFRSDVPLDFMTRPDLARYLKTPFAPDNPPAPPRLGPATPVRLAPPPPGAARGAI